MRSPLFNSSKSKTSSSLTISSRLCSTGQMIDSIHIYSNFGEHIMSKDFKGEPNNTFSLVIGERLKTENKSVWLLKEGIAVLTVPKPQVRLCAVVTREIAPIIVLEILNKIYKILVHYLGEPVNDESIKRLLSRYWCLCLLPRVF